jgi:hypothetical protein
MGGAEADGGDVLRGKFSEAAVGRGSLEEGRADVGGWDDVDARLET